MTVEGVPDERLAEPLEAAVYFVVAESLTNAVKHAEATELRVRMAPTNGELRVEIADDGRGGADPSAATAPACAGSPTASRRSAAGSRSSRRRARARSCARCCRSPDCVTTAR